MMMVIGVHVCYFQRTQLVTRIFVMLCVSVLLYQARASLPPIIGTFSIRKLDGC